MFTVIDEVMNYSTSPRTRGLRTPGQEVAPEQAARDFFRKHPHHWLHKKCLSCTKWSEGGLESFHDWNAFQCRSSVRCPECDQWSPCRTNRSTDNAWHCPCIVKCNICQSSSPPLKTVEERMAYTCKSCYTNCGACSEATLKPEYYTEGSVVYCMWCKCHNKLCDNAKQQQLDFCSDDCQTKWAEYLNALQSDDELRSGSSVSIECVSSDENDLDSDSDDD